MREWRGIEELRLSAHRPPGPLPSVSLRLLEAIRAHGPIEAVVVRQTGAYQYEILSNPETWLAVQRLGHHDVPVEIRTDVSDEKAAEIVAAAYGVDRTDPLGEAEQLAAQLEALGGRVQWGAIRRLAARTGLSRSYISHALRLLELPDAIRQLIRSGQLHVGHAKLLVTIKDRREQWALARTIIDDGLSVRATAERARAVRAGLALPAAAVDPEPDPDVVRLERAVTDVIGCHTRIDAEAGRLVIDYGGDLEVLEGVLERLGYRAW